jgi:hypothetical protein
MAGTTYGKKKEKKRNSGVKKKERSAKARVHGSCGPACAPAARTD